MKGRAELKRVGEQLLLRVRATRTAALTMSGLDCLAASAWTAFGLPAGLAAAGIALIVLEFLSGEDPQR